MGLVPHPRAITHLEPLELEINYNYNYNYSKPTSKNYDD
jgi:hypothetical protein